MNKYGPKAQQTISETLDKYKQGKLSFSGGRKVKSHKQAVAIGVNEARKKGYKVPSEDRSN